ncbi:MAG: hypothetical protein AAF915_26110 [Cyanobacteria bacterium P01_D01_bin.50]
MKETKFMKCPECNKAQFILFEGEVVYSCPFCKKEFPILSKLKIETIEDFIIYAAANNLYLVLKDNLGRRYLKLTTKEYFNEIIKNSLSLVLYKHDFKEYTLICYWSDDDCNFKPVSFVIEKDETEQRGVTPA